MGMEQEFPFLFSVIVPVYNTEQYLEETLESVVNQTIGFQENIQLILVNNATEDDSGVICERYLAEYPNNVVYITLEKNAGPAGAREAGTQYVKGKYVNFLDSDDKWDRSAFAKALNFLDANQDVDFAACRVKHFDGRNKYHALDYKFQSTRVVDIRKEYDHIQLHPSSVILRAETVRKYHFETDLLFVEDAQFFTNIVLEKCKYGVVREAVFFYRTRKIGISHLEETVKNKEWYFIPPVRVYRWALDEAKRRQLAANSYVQYLVAYEMQWRLFRKFPNGFSREEKNAYRALLHDLLVDIEDEIILKLRHIHKREKMSMLIFKYGESFKNQIHLFDSSVFGNGIEFWSYHSGDSLKLEIFELYDDVLKLQGTVLLPHFQNSFNITVLDENGTAYPVKILYREEISDDKVLLLDSMQKYAFSVEIDLHDEMKFYFAVCSDGAAYLINLSDGLHFPLTRELDNSHCCRGNWRVHLVGEQIVVHRRSRLSDFKAQWKLWKELARKKKRKALLCHLFVWLRSLLPHRKKIWIFSDRTAFAGDNGEYMFRYVRQKKNPGVKAFYSLSPDSPDYSAVKRFGPVLNNQSKRFKLLYLLADRIISTQHDPASVDPLGVHTPFVKDLIHSKRVYLQHGIIKDDFTGNDGKIRRDIAGFITSAEMERNSLLTFSYGYTPEEVWLTGLARYDGLYGYEKTQGNIVFIAPTWRSYFPFFERGADNTMKDCPEFTETEYYEFYSKLLSDSRLLEVMRRNKYRGVFRQHPMMMHCTHYFPENDVFSVEVRAQGYHEEIRSTALFVTDYSSTAFDYAYAFRPCIYAQFDRETFISSHVYKPGYFDYETMGFGPVCYDYESTVQAIIHAIESGCEMEEQYRKRAESFFAFRDNNNRERIYNKILKLDQEGSNG